MKNLVLILVASAMPVLAQAWSQPVREVEKPHMSPYQVAGGLAFGSNCSNCATQIFPALPSGKRLVMEQVSIAVQTPVGGEFRCSVGPAGGPWVALQVPQRAVGYLQLNHPVRLYVDTQVVVTCTRDEASPNQWVGSVVVVGHLVNKQ